MKKYYITVRFDYDYAIEVPDDNIDTIGLEAEMQDPIWGKISSLVTETPKVLAYFCQTTEIIDDETGETIWKAK